MRVLVTGASGLIGSRLCDALLARGDEVVGLTRDPDRAREHQPDPVTGTRGAPRPSARRPRRLEGVDGRRQPDRRADRPALDRRRQASDPRKPRAGDQEPRRRAERGRADAPNVWSASQGSATTAIAATRWSTSRAPAGDSFDARVCVAWESAARAAEELGMRIAITRTGLVLDPEERPASPAASSLQARARWADRAAATSTCRGSTSLTR